jgi:hypothetical protein
MKRHAWIIPTFPIFAIVIGGVISFGGLKAALWLGENWWSLTGQLKTSEVINAAFDKVISYQDWIAAGLQADSEEKSAFSRRRFEDYPSSFDTQRHFFAEGSRGSVLASIETVDARKRHFALFRKGVTLAEGVLPGRSDPSDAWHVLAWKVDKDGTHYDLSGWLFCGGVRVEVSLASKATKQQALGFQRMIETGAQRLAANYEADFKPYVDRLAPREGSPR